MSKTTEITTESTPLTTKDMLNEVEKAINAVLIGGQSYKIGSRSFTRANLTELKNWRTQLKSELASDEDNTGNGLFGFGVGVGVFEGR